MCDVVGYMVRYPIWKSDVDSMIQIKYISGMHIQTTVSFPRDSLYAELEK